MHAAFQWWEYFHCLKSYGWTLPQQLCWSVGLLCGSRNRWECHLCRSCDMKQKIVHHSSRNTLYTTPTVAWVNIYLIKAYFNARIYLGFDEWNKSYQVRNNCWCLQYSVLLIAWTCYLYIIKLYWILSSCQNWILFAISKERS